MFRYTWLGINSIALMITFLIFILFNLFYINLNFFIQLDRLEKEQYFAKLVKEESYCFSNPFQISIKKNYQKISIQKIKMQSKTKNYKWNIIIPRISLCAPIAEGTTKEIMDQYVGHFEHTSILNGNIGLAAHNKGYPVNYFKDIKELELEDEIIYETTNEKKIYKVATIEIIKDTNWEYLKDTNDNRITLITCVENKPEYRRCIQAIEIKKETEEFL